MKRILTLLLEAHDFWLLKRLWPHLPADIQNRTLLRVRIEIMEAGITGPAVDRELKRFMTKIGLNEKGK